MRITKSLVVAAAIVGLAGAGTGSAFAAYVGGPPPVLTGSDHSSVIVCHGKNAGGTGTIVFHSSGAVTGNPNATGDCCLPE